MAALNSVNHKLPSAPLVIRKGRMSEPAGNSLILPVAGSILPILPLLPDPASVNQTAPSGPVNAPRGAAGRQRIFRDGAGGSDLFDEISPASCETEVSVAIGGDVC